MSDGKTDWRTPALLLMIMTAAMQLSFAGWWALIKNFAVDEIAVTGFEIGIQETFREIPGFLAFLAVYLTIFLREQKIAIISLVFLGAGVAATGYFPTLWGFYLTTLIMSVGFHYFETMNQSLALQWLPKDRAPEMMGRILAVSSFATLIAYALIYVTWNTLHLGYETVFMIAGSCTLIVAAFVVIVFPQFPQKVEQRKEFVLRKRYWLYYAMTFMDGGRRQIFTVFAGFLMIEKFGYQVHEIAALFFINGALNMFLAPALGRLIIRIGERRTLQLEYAGLFIVFTSYAFVENVWLAGALYVIDHAFFALSIAMKTYFQKIADPADIAPTAGVAFTINHISAVIIPAAFGLVWLYSPAIVFLAGAAMALCSFALARCVPRAPDAGQETVFSSGARPHPAE